MLPVRISDPGSNHSLAVEYPRIYNAAFCASGLAPVTSVTLEDAAISKAAVSVQIPEIRYEAQASLSRPGSCWKPSRPTAETLSALERISNPTRTEILVRIDDREVARFPMLLTDAWSWPHEETARIVSGSYVLPGDRKVAGMISEVFGGEPTSSARNAGGQWGAMGMMAAFYRHVSGSWRLRYAPPRIMIDDTLSGASYQKIASPQDVLAHASERQGSGNCLDLTLLFASCFESLGYQPLIFFVGEPGKAPSHAFPGVWSSRARRFQPVLTDQSDLYQRVREGDIVAFEATGVCRGSTALSVENALTAARARFENHEPIHAVDIGALRPPAGQGHPLELPNAAVVQRILWKTQQFALESGAPRLETLHLLYGLCTAGGDTIGVLKRAGVDAKQLIGFLEKRRGGASVQLPPSTQNYENCWRAARANAQTCGRSRLEEIDVLWALMENPGRNLSRMLAAAGGDLVLVATEVARLGGRPGIQSISLDLPNRTE